MLGAVEAVEDRVLIKGLRAEGIDERVVHYTRDSHL